MSRCCYIDLEIEEEQVIDFEVEEQIVYGGGYLDYEGPYDVTPRFTEQVLPTEDKHMLEDVTIEPIEVSRTSNPYGGKTVYIGGTI